MNDGFLLIALIALALVAVFFIFADKKNDKLTKSERRRKLMTDLYVIGRIKQLATKNGIDLKQEMKEFLETEKEVRSYEQPLDITIEEELQGKILNVTESSDKKKGLSTSANVTST